MTKLGHLLVPVGLRVYCIRGVVPIGMQLVEEVKSYVRDVGGWKGVVDDGKGWVWKRGFYGLPDCNPS